MLDTWLQTSSSNSVKPATVEKVTLESAAWGGGGLEDASVDKVTAEQA